MPPISNDWLVPLKPEFGKPYYAKLYKIVNEEYRTKVIYPPADDIFNAFAFTPLSEVKVVILGQDPYHEPGQAQGLSFSVPRGMKQPPSLVNIFKEMQADLGIRPPDHGCLEGWAREGVLLLNAVLTVREHQANSHRGKGWENFTDSIIEALNNRQKPLVFILWGNNAKAKAKLITSPRHHIITGAHPSPLSAHNGFWGGRYFSGTNEFLEEQGIEPINWKL